MRKLSPTLLWIACVLALAALLVSPALGQGRERTPGFPPGLAEARLIKERSKEIGVGEETLAKLEKLTDEIRAEDEALQSKTVEARNKVQALLDDAQPDEKELMAAVGAAADVARKTREHRVMASLRIRALLTKEQLGKFMEIRNNAVGKRRRGGRPGVRK